MLQRFVVLLLLRLYAYYREAYAAVISDIHLDGCTPLASPEGLMQSVALSLQRYAGSRLIFDSSIDLLFLFRINSITSSADSRNWARLHFWTSRSIL